MRKRRECIRPYHVADWKLGTSFGAASKCRRIDPKTGEVIGTVERQEVVAVRAALAAPVPAWKALDREVSRIEREIAGDA
jgi:hypothetical protein